ncbi:MAG: type II toxin-antitoxin system Phd/YefM family antitoxin [Methylococcaceae bacterium]|nr:type II toxin-antitoxin system Phd/YefM family antitoxin [Methylococcaceae bacterium]
MQIINIHEAKTHLSRLLEQVEGGEDVVIARAGQPIARLSRYRERPGKIAPPGAMEGQVWIADDFDAPVDDLFDCLNSPP